MSVDGSDLHLEDHLAKSILWRACDRVDEPPAVHLLQEVYPRPYVQRNGASIPRKQTREQHSVRTDDGQEALSDVVRIEALGIGGRQGGDDHALVVDHRHGLDVLHVHHPETCSTPRYALYDQHPLRSYSSEYAGKAAHTFQRRLLGGDGDELRLERATAQRIAQPQLLNSDRVRVVWCGTGYITEWFDSIGDGVVRTAC